MGSRSTFRTTFVVYSGDPTIKESKQDLHKLKTPETRLQFNEKVESIENHVKATKDFLQSHIRRWQLACHHLERRARDGKAPTATQHLPSLLPTSTASHCTNTLGVALHGMDESETSVKAEPQSTTDPARAICGRGKSTCHKEPVTSPQAPIAPAHNEFIELMWSACETGLRLIWPTFCITRRPCLEARIGALALLLGPNFLPDSAPSHGGVPSPSKPNDSSENVQYLQPDTFGNDSSQHMGITDAQPRLEEALEASLASVLRQNVAVRLSTCENIIITSLGSYFWQLEHVETNQCSGESPTTLPRRSGRPTTHCEGDSGQCLSFLTATTPLTIHTGAEAHESSLSFEVAEKLATRTAESACQLLSPLLLDLRNVVSLSAWTLDSIARDPSHYVRIMNVFLLAALFWFKTRPEAALGRTWLDLALWMCKNAPFAQHLPLFETVKQRIESLHLECGAYGEMQWLSEMEACAVEMAQNVGHVRAATNFLESWVVQGCDKVDYRLLLKGFTWKRSKRLRPPPAAALLHHLVAHYVVAFKRDWTSSSGQHHWEWIDQKTSILGRQKRHKPEPAHLHPTPTDDFSAPPLHSPMWDDLEPESTDSSATVEVDSVIPDHDSSERISPPLGLNAHLVSRILLLFTTAFAHNLGNVLICASFRNGSPKCQHHPDVTPLGSTEGASTLRRCWAALLMHCGIWLGQERHKLALETSIGLRIQYHLAAATLSAVMHTHWHVHIQHCLDIIRPLSLQQRRMVLDAVSSKVHPKTAPHISKQWRLLLECVTNNRWNIAVGNVERHVATMRCEPAQQMETMEEIGAPDTPGACAEFEDDIYWSEMLQTPDTLALDEESVEWSDLDLAVTSPTHETHPTNPSALHDSWHFSYAALDSAFLASDPTALLAPPNDDSHAAMDPFHSVFHEAQDEPSEFEFFSPCVAHLTELLPPSHPPPQQYTQNHSIRDNPPPPISKRTRGTPKKATSTRPHKRLPTTKAPKPWESGTFDFSYIPFYS